MRTIGNLLWLVLAGFWLALAYAFAGLINLVFIVTIPFSIQAFKLAGYALWPFGRVVVHRPERVSGGRRKGSTGSSGWLSDGCSSSSSSGTPTTATSSVWLLSANVAVYVRAPVILTVIGFPLGVANLKMAGLALAPFGKRVVTLKEAAAMGAPIVARVDDLEDR